MPRTARWWDGSRWRLFRPPRAGSHPPCSARWRESIARLRVSLIELEPCDSLPRLVRGEVDVVLALDWCNAPLALPDGLAKAPVFDDVADMALPSTHRLARSAW